jgi:hypothetical protein
MIDRLNNNFLCACTSDIKIYVSENVDGARGF